MPRVDYDRAQTRRRIVSEATSWLAHGLLYGFGYLPSRHQPERSRDIRTLVLIHGLGSNRSAFFPLQAYLWRVGGHDRQYSYNYRAGSGSVEALALDLKRRLKREVQGGRIDIVAHSMGGLIARTWLQALGGHRRVDRLVTLATPHAGTHSSIYLPTRISSQLRPESPLLRFLDTLPPPAGVRCTSIAAGRDLVVVPGPSAVAPFGETEHFDDLGHLDLLLSPRVFRSIRSALA